jgi:hypothetical protein
MEEASSFSAMLNAVAQEGFAILVAAYLLVRLERKIAALTEAISNLRYCQVCRYRGEDAS